MFAREHFINELFQRQRIKAGVSPNPLIAVMDIQLIHDIYVDFNFEANTFFSKKGMNNQIRYI